MPPPLRSPAAVSRQCASRRGEAHRDQALARCQACPRRRPPRLQDHIGDRGGAWARPAALLGLQLAAQPQRFPLPRGADEVHLRAEGAVGWQASRIQAMRGAASRARSAGACDAGQQGDPRFHHGGRRRGRHRRGSPRVPKLNRLPSRGGAATCGFDAGGGGAARRGEAHWLGPHDPNPP